MTQKWEEITKYLGTIDQATTEDIYSAVSFSYYCNWRKHLGMMLVRMVRAGRVERVKPGVFRLPKAARDAKEIAAGQMFLF